MEDTAFYVYNRLVSLNEVGGEPGRFGLSVADFHRQNLARQRHWPYGLLATSTHDTKRSEDVRARINVLSEMPAAWARHVRRWSRMTASLRRDGVPAPNEELLPYQTLAGAQPSHSRGVPSLGSVQRRLAALARQLLGEEHRQAAHPGSSAPA